MWCDLGESVGSRTCDIFSFLISIWLKSSLGEVHFPENPTWIGSVVPKFEQLKDSQNNRKQKKCIPFSGCISQSICSVIHDQQWMWSKLLHFFKQSLSTKWLWCKLQCHLHDAYAQVGNEKSPNSWHNSNWLMKNQCLKNSDVTLTKYDAKNVKNGNVIIPTYVLYLVGIYVLR